MKKSLLNDRRFQPLFWTQFLGAFNDNAFKNAIVILIAFKGLSVGRVSPKEMVAFCAGIFILPFFLFSGTAGQLADKYSKSSIVVWVKVCEVLIMAAGACGFASGRVSLLLAALFLMGVHSTVFGPVKYSILPQLIDPEELVSGTALVEMGTFIAILLGTILGGVLIALPSIGPWAVGGAVITLALLGLAAALRIGKVATTAPALRVRFNPVAPTIEILRLAARDKTIFWSILGISWFWFLGASVLSLLPSYCKEFLHADEAVATLFLALFSIGVGSGSMLFKRLSPRKLELGPVQLGSLGMSLFALDIFLSGKAAALPPGAAESLSIARFLSSPGGWRIAFDFIFFSVFGGVFIVPLYTLLQQRGEAGERSRVIAGNNILNALFMVASALFLAILFRENFTIPQIFLILALLNLVFPICASLAVPEFLFAFVSWTRANLFHKTESAGDENIPAEGPALLIFDLAEGVDWTMAAAVFRRPVRFLAPGCVLRGPLERLLSRGSGALAPGAPASSFAFDAQVEAAAAALLGGELVGLALGGPHGQGKETERFFIALREKIAARPKAPSFSGERESSDDGAGARGALPVLFVLASRAPPAGSAGENTAAFPPIPGGRLRPRILFTVGERIPFREMPQFSRFTTH